MPRRRGANKERSMGRRMWTIMEEECLVAALRNLVVIGWKCDNGFQTGYLGQLESYIAKHFPQANIKVNPHIISKLHEWKKTILDPHHYAYKVWLWLGRKSEHCNR
ncbi:UNVERIFIED_CONTAM: hypothetical protein Sindi_2679400 [Sesamum indicum]